jgi:hypothetical protein
MTKRRRTIKRFAKDVKCRNGEKIGHGVGYGLG